MQPSQVHTVYWSEDMSIEVKKISELPEASSATGDELFEMVQDGKNVKILADDLMLRKDELLIRLSNKIDKVYGKQLSDQNYTLYDRNKLASLPLASNLYSMLNEKVDSEWGKGLIEPAPRNGKQYARKNDAWVEIESGLKTQLVGTTLYMSDDGSNPVPVEPTYSTFSYEIEVGGYVDLGGTFADYGVNEISPEPFGHFIDKIENNKTGILRAVGWSYNQEFGYSVGVIAENSDYLLTYDNNIELIIKDLNGEILSLIIPPENINSPMEGIVIFMAHISEEQFNILPTSGRVSVDITIETSGEVNKPDVEIFKYEFEVGQDIGSNYAYYGLNGSVPYGSIIESDNDKILRRVYWAEDHGYYFSIMLGNMDYPVESINNAVLTVRDQNGEIINLTITPNDIFEWDIGVIAFETIITAEEFNLLPESGRVFIELALESKPIPEPEIFSYKFEAEDSLNGAYGVSISDYGYGVYGTFIENDDNDKIGKVTSIAWDYDPDFGSNLIVVTENSDHLLNNDYNITINISDQNGEIFSITLPSRDVWNMITGEVMIGYELWEEDFDLLPKSGIVYVDIILEPIVNVQPW